MMAFGRKAVGCMGEIRTEVGWGIGVLPVQVPVVHPGAAVSRAISSSPIPTKSSNSGSGFLHRSNSIAV